jgi:hypothetical protein
MNMKKSRVPKPESSTKHKLFDFSLENIKKAMRGLMHAKKETKKSSTKPKRWVANVTTDSTHPPKGLFTKNAETIARTLAYKRVSPKGRSSGLRMLTYFINRGGRGLSASRRAELEKAKKLLSQRIAEEKKRAA